MRKLKEKESLSWIRLWMMLVILDWFVIQGDAAILKRGYRELNTLPPAAGELVYAILWLGSNQKYTRENLHITVT